MSDVDIEKLKEDYPEYKKIFDCITFTQYVYWTGEKNAPPKTGYKDFESAIKASEVIIDEPFKFLNLRDNLVDLIITKINYDKLIKMLKPFIEEKK